jgi:protein tyrosine/serine phosphatase
MRMDWFSVPRRIPAACIAVLIALACNSARAENNFHPIVDGKAYRSAQPSPEEIEAYRKTYRIATIINLRGKQTGQAWYDAEVKAAKALGIRHVDFAMSPRRILQPAQSQALIALMKSAPKPILIHCQAGSDRTGLAAALYLAAIEKTGEKAAEGQLALRFGHLSIPVLGAFEMDWSFELMEEALGFPNS